MSSNGSLVRPEGLTPHPSPMAPGIPAYLHGQQFIERPGSVECPVCASTATAVYDSRHRGGTVARRRACVNGHRFSTEEMIRTEGHGLDGLATVLATLTLSDFRMVCALADRLAEER